MIVVSLMDESDYAPLLVSLADDKEHVQEDVAFSVRQGLTFPNMGETTRALSVDRRSSACLAHPFALSNFRRRTWLPLSIMDEMCCVRWRFIHSI